MLEFAIPSLVGRALPIWALGERARLVGVRARLEYEEIKSPPRMVRVRCEAPMAVFFKKELQRLAAEATAGDEFDLHAATARAMAAVEDAIASTSEPPRDTPSKS